MTEAPLTPQFSWICAGCGRTVPNRFDICRCGVPRDSDEPMAGDQSGVQVPAVASSAGSEQPRTSSPMAWLVLAVVAAAAAGTLIALQVIPVKTAPATIVTGAPKDFSSSVAPAAGMEGVLSPDALFAPNASSAPTAPGAPVAPSAPVAPDAPVQGGSLEDVVSRSIPAIVSIEAGQGRGSGFFVAPRIVVTNRHVVQDNVSVVVRLSNGQTLPGRVETASSDYDLAIVRVDSASPSQALLPLGTVNDVRPGQEVIAIGLAMGVFQNSVTRGIISGIRRVDRTVMLQTDAAINAGNSGGPLLNRNGQVVGINTLKVGGAAESLGFALAADHARAVLAGAKGSEPFAPSVQQSQQIAPAFGARSSADAERDQGTKKYADTVEAIARESVKLDNYWTRIKTNCAVRVAPGYDREWFGLWDGRAKLDTPDPACGSAVQELEDLASQVRTMMTTAEEAARRASVLPGDLRDIRRRYRMEWPGFGR